MRPHMKSSKHKLLLEFKNIKNDIFKNFKLKNYTKTPKK